MNNKRNVRISPQIVEQFERNQEAMLIKGGEKLCQQQTAFINLFNCKCKKNSNDNGCASCATKRRRRNRRKKNITTT